MVKPAFQLNDRWSPSSSTSEKITWPLAPCLTTIQVRPRVALMVRMTGLTVLWTVFFFLAWAAVEVVCCGGRLGFRARAGLVCTGCVGGFTAGGGEAFSPPKRQATKNSTATATMPASATITALPSSTYVKGF